MRHLMRDVIQSESPKVLWYFGDKYYKKNHFWLVW